MPISFTKGIDPWAFFKHFFYREQNRELIIELLTVWRTGGPVESLIVPHVSTAMTFGGGVSPITVASYPAS